jgi:nicotinate-nucleotide adenylyltransferase
MQIKRRHFMSRSLKIGIMGGTFDPVHIGHLFIAEAARDAFQLDRVIFIPTGDPPHKKANHLAPGEDRIIMLKAAISGNPAFRVDAMEVTREGTTYTVDTLKELRGRYLQESNEGAASLYFIIGGDTLMELKTWKSFETVAGLCSFIVYRRPGYREEELENEAQRLYEVYGADIHFAEGPFLEISSRYLRHRLVMGQTIRYLVPEAVENYIHERHLYKGE